MQKRAFTLIELLIVVAIIAILAAIAVPNFLEAQVRSKVSRCAADIRTIRVALESYRVDTNKYPETDWGEANLATAGCGMIRVTTPVAYLTSVPKSPFKEETIGGGGNRHTKQNIWYLYVNALKGNDSRNVDGNGDTFDDSYQADRTLYLKASTFPNMALMQFSREGYWMLKSVGPNNFDDRSPPAGITITLASVYDPTNGTVSAGDVMVFSDTQGFGGLR